MPPSKFLVTDSLCFYAVQYWSLVSISRYVYSYVYSTINEIVGNVNAPMRECKYGLKSNIREIFPRNYGVTWKNIFKSVRGPCCVLRNPCSVLRWSMNRAQVQTGGSVGPWVYIKIYLYFLYSIPLCVINFKKIFLLLNLKRH